MLVDGRLHTVTFLRLISVLKPQGHYSESPTACGLFLYLFHRYTGCVETLLKKKLKMNWLKKILCTDYRVPDGRNMQVLPAREKYIVFTKCKNFKQSRILQWK